LCALWVYSCMALAFFLIKKYEGASSPDSNGDDGGDREEALPRVRPGVVYLEDCWKTCLEGIHPGWLLAFRVVAFFVLASLLVVDIITDGWSIFLYYTQLAHFHPRISSTTNNKKNYAKMMLYVWQDGQMSYLYLLRGVPRPTRLRHRI
jgi:hypothetical protein